MTDEHQDKNNVCEKEAEITSQNIKKEDQKAYYEEKSMKQKKINKAIIKAEKRKYTGSSIVTYDIKYLKRQFTTETYKAPLNKLAIENFVKSVKVSDDFMEIILEEWTAKSEDDFEEGITKDFEIRKRKINPKAITEKKDLIKICGEADIKALDNNQKRGLLAIAELQDELNNAIRNDIVNLLLMKLAEGCYLYQEKNNEPKIIYDIPEKIMEKHDKDLSDLNEILSNIEKVSKTTASKKLSTNGEDCGRFFDSIENIIKTNCIPKAVWPVCSYMIYKYLKKHPSSDMGTGGNNINDKIRPNILSATHSDLNAIRGLGSFSHMLNTTALGKQYRTLNAYIFNQYTSYYEICYYTNKYGNFVDVEEKSDILYEKERSNRQNYEHKKKEALKQIFYIDQVEKNDKETTKKKASEKTIKESRLFDNYMKLIPLKPFFFKMCLEEHSIFTCRKDVCGSQIDISKIINKKIDKAINKMFSFLLDSQERDYERIIDGFFNTLLEYSQSIEFPLDNDEIEKNFNKTICKKFVDSKS